MKSSMNIALLLSIFTFLLSWTMIEGQRHLTATGDCTTSSRCAECAPRDCDNDNQCRQGLLCADAHGKELRAAGLDHRKAYCKTHRELTGSSGGKGGKGGKGGDDFDNREFCYDPKKVRKMH